MRAIFLFCCLSLSLFAEEKIRVYFAGPLFSIQTLVGNEALARAVEEKSNHRFLMVLPQDLMQEHSANPKAIRNQDFNTLLSCKAGLFNFNGEELDSGSVAEYMMAKFSDMPTVVLRTDYRDIGKDCQTWNLMVKFFPRNETLILDGVKIYSENQDNRKKTLDIVATEVVAALDKVLQSKPLLEEREKVRSWIDCLLTAE